MSGLKHLRSRLNTVKSTQKITKAMQVVSAAKLNKLKVLVEEQNIFARELQNIMSDIAHSPELGDLDPSYLNFFTKPAANLPVLGVVMTSDRGLCGGFNTQILKKLKKDLIDFSDQNRAVKLIVIGKAGYEALKRSHADAIVKYYPSAKGDLELTIKAVKEDIASMLSSEEIGECYFYFNKFKNALSQIPSCSRVLPVFSDKEVENEINISQTEESDSSHLHHHAWEEGKKYRVLSQYEYEGSNLIQNVVDLYIHGQLYYSLLQSRVSEEGARMSAMDNATRNAGELIEKLALELNRSRQAMITTELTEIISGAETV